MKRAVFTLIVAAGVCIAGPAHAERTVLTVRTIAKGAKFVGSSMGGVRIVVRDVDSGQVLASGVTKGSTGDTARLMTRVAAPWTPRSSPGAASYTAILNLDEPRLVEVSAVGPLAQRQALVRVSTTVWLAPGKHVTGGDGLVLELPGLVVDVTAPGNHGTVARKAGGGFEVRANVTMMCGCPLEPAGLWDASAMQVEARVRYNGGRARTVKLSYAGAPNQFAGRIPATRAGNYVVTVVAHDPRNGNTGVDRVSVLVK